MIRRIKKGYIIRKCAIILILSISAVLFLSKSLFAQGSVVGYAFGQGWIGKNQYTLTTFPTDTQLAMLTHVIASDIGCHADSRLFPGKLPNELSARLDKMTNAPKNPNVGIFDESETAKNFSFSLFPNPTSGFVTIDYTLHVDAPICIELFNMFGQRLKMIVPQQDQKVGTYSVQISVSDLGIGAYIVKVTSGNQVASKQLVVNQ